MLTGAEQEHIVGEGGRYMSSSRNLENDSSLYKGENVISKCDPMMNTKGM